MKNEPIGEVDCPAKGCDLRVPLFKFRARPAENMRRLAGKLYCRCKVHGQFGGIGEAAGMQDFLLEGGKPEIWAPKNAGAAGNQASESPAMPATESSPPLQKLPATAPARPASSPAPNPPAPPATPASKAANILSKIWGLE